MKIKTGMPKDIPVLLVIIRNDLEKIKISVTQLFTKHCAKLPLKNLSYHRYIASIAFTMVANATYMDYEKNI